MVDVSDSRADLCHYIRTARIKRSAQEYDAERLQVYRHLFRTNIEQFVSSAFPILKTVLAASIWDELIDAFMSDHVCQSPYFKDVSEAFLNFLTTVPEAILKQYPFILELAHYEWIELVVDTCESIDENKALLLDVPLTQQPLKLSDSAVFLQYEYPVHQICVSFMPNTPPAEPTWIVVYRDRNYGVQFQNLNAAAAILLHPFAQSGVIVSKAFQSQMTKEMMDQVALWCHQGILVPG